MQLVGAKAAVEAGADVGVDVADVAAVAAVAVAVDAESGEDGATEDLTG